MAVFWIGAFIVFVAAEALTVSLTCIWFAGGALGALAVQVLGGGVKLQFALFAAVSFGLKDKAGQNQYRRTDRKEGRGEGYHR